MSAEKAILLRELTNCVGHERRVSMAVLYARVFGQPVRDKINDTRSLRKIITEARWEGLAICHDSSSDGGYYLAESVEEVKSQNERRKKRALKMLAMNAVAEKKTMPEYLGQISMELETTERKGVRKK